MKTPNLITIPKIFLGTLSIALLFSCQEIEPVEDEIEDVITTPLPPEPEGEVLNPILPPVDPDNPNSVVGPMDAVTAIPYSEIPDKEYLIDLVKWDIPNNKTAPEKTTDNIQAAIDWAIDEGYGRVRLPAGHYLIGKYGNDVYQAGIELKSNMAFLLDKDAIIEMAPNDKWNYCAIAVTRKARVVISGGTILGDKENHSYTPRAGDGKANHDEGHLICITTASEYVTVKNMVLGKATGDGVFLAAWDGDGSSVKHINISNNNITSNRRQGISVVGGTDLLIENNEIHHTKGANPGYGIDIESIKYTSKDIIVRSNYFHHNRGDMLNFDGRNVLFEGNILTQGEGSTYLDAPLLFWNKSDMTIRNNDITQISQSVNNWNAVVMNSYGKEKSSPNTTFIYNNTCNNCGFFMYDGGNLIIRDNTLNHGHLVFRDMDNIKVFNNKITHPDINWAFRLKNVSGLSSGNTYNGVIYEIPIKENQIWIGNWNG